MTESSAAAVANLKSQNSVSTLSKFQISKYAARILRCNSRADDSVNLLYQNSETEIGSIDFKRRDSDS